MRSQTVVDFDSDDHRDVDNVEGFILAVQENQCFSFWGQDGKIWMRHAKGLFAREKNGKWAERGAVQYLLKVIGLHRNAHGMVDDWLQVAFSRNEIMGSGSNLGTGEEF